MLRDKELVAAYLAFRIDPAGDGTTDGQWCAQRGVSIQDLKAWKASEPGWAAKVLAERRKRYAEELSQVDAALMEKAKAGDTKAAALLYARFENWTPRVAELDNKKSGGRAKTLAELISEGV